MPSDIIEKQLNYPEVIGKQPNYHFLVVEDDPYIPLVFDSYIDIITNNLRFEKKFGRGKITKKFARDLTEANSNLEDMLRDPHGIVVIFMDQVLGEARGLRFINQEKFKLANYRVKTLLISGHPEEVDDPRRQGAYKFLQKPVSLEDLFNATENAVRSILFKQMPVKRPLPYPLEIKVLESPDEMLERLKITYQVFGPEGMNYISEEFLNKAKLDANAWEPYSIPFGGFLCIDGKKIMVTALRMITPDVQEGYWTFLRKSLTELKEKDLLERISTIPPFGFPSESAYDFQDLYRQHEGSRVCELSRTTVPDCVQHPLDPDNDFILRGFGLSRHIMEYGVAQALFNGYPIAPASCDIIHSEMYGKYGYQKVTINPKRLRTTEMRIVNGTDIFMDSVANVSNMLFADFRSLPEPSQTNVKRIVEHFKSGNLIHTLPTNK